MSVRGLRVVVRAGDYAGAVGFFRDVLGLPERGAVAGAGGAAVTILDAGRATLELANAEQHAYIDEVEVGRAVAPRIRLAFEVDDVAAATAALLAAGASELAARRPTPFGSVNARLEAPAELQITLFERTGGARPGAEEDPAGGGDREIPDAHAGRGPADGEDLVIRHAEPGAAGGPASNRGPEIRDAGAGGGRRRTGNRHLVIRGAEAGDWGGIWPFFRAIVAAGETYTWPRDMSEDAARAAWFPAPPGRTVVALLDGTIVGSAKTQPNQAGPGAHVANASFMVDPAYGGRGIGRALGEHVLAQARADGYRAMQFNAVVASNAGAFRLWRSLGFEVVGEVPAAFDHPRLGPVPLLIMHRSL